MAGTTTMTSTTLRPPSKLSEIVVEEGLKIVNNGIERLKRVAAEPSLLRPPFNSQEYSLLYTTIYNLCNEGDECRQQLYDLCKHVLVDFINSMVLPPVDELSLEEFIKIWSRYKQITKWLLHLFGYLDRVQRKHPKLNQVALTCFRDLVFLEISDKVEGAAIELIALEREGGKVDGALLRGVVEICFQFGMKIMDYYEDKLGKDAYLCPEYMLKCEECLRKEKLRVEYYLYSSGKHKYLEVARNELVLIYQNQLLQNEHSSCHALLKQNKMEVLLTMFRLYDDGAMGLDPIAKIFKEHIIDEGTALIQRGKDPAMHNILAMQLKKLRDKFMDYVTDYFNGHTIFDKALKEGFEILLNKGIVDRSIVAAFEILLNKGVAGRSSVDPQASQVMTQLEKLQVRSI